MKKRPELPERDLSSIYILVMLILVAIVALLVVALGPSPVSGSNSQPNSAPPQAQAGDLALELMAQNPDMSAHDAESAAGKAVYMQWLTGKDARLILANRKNASQKR